MESDVDRLYFEYLCSSITDQSFVKDFRRVLRRLYDTEFVWTIPLDADRAWYGMLIREVWLESSGFDTNSEWAKMGCSVLEMLLGLEGISFETFAEEIPDGFFWEMLYNLGVLEYPDQQYVEHEIDDILSRFVWRNYDEYGRGGIFPRILAVDDQRELDLWHQCNGYILEFYLAYGR